MVNTKNNNLIYIPPELVNKIIQMRDKRLKNIANKMMNAFDDNKNYLPFPSKRPLRFLQKYFKQPNVKNQLDKYDKMYLSKYLEKTLLRRSLSVFAYYQIRRVDEDTPNTNNRLNTNNAFFMQKANPSYWLNRKMALKNDTRPNKKELYNAILPEDDKVVTKQWIRDWKRFSKIEL